MLDSLARPKAIQVEALSSSINATILKLASQRAGLQIDELPEPFLDRINGLVTGVAQELAEGKVHLNEDDYATMKPHLANLGYEVVVNPNLMRGDITLQFDGVEVHDVAAKRMAGYSAVDSDNAAAGNTAADDTAATGDTTAANDAAATSDNSAADGATAETATTDIAAHNDADKHADLANMLTGDVSLPPSDEPNS